MTKFLKLFLASLLIVAGMFTINSCKKNFDNPPSYIDPNMVANTTIKSLKALHTVGGFEGINTNVIISGTVVADDKSGNFYKELYIQDETGAISLKLDASSLYTQYPVGRKVFIKCNGLYLSDYAGMIQLGVMDRSIPNNPALAGIPSSLFDTYVVKGSLNNPVVARSISQSQLTTNMQDTLLGTLVKLSGYEFSSGDTSRTYADTSAAKNSINLTVKDCSNNSIIVRSSGYANFAGLKPTRGNGSITAIYTKFNTTPQLIIRDTTDVKFNGERCSIFEEDFSTVTTNNAVLNSSINWYNIGEVGSVKYQNALFGSVKCAKISAFATGVANVTSWLISPAIPIPTTGAPKLSFTTAGGFNVGVTDFRVFVSTNYNGGASPSTATWVQLPATMATAPASGFGAFVPSGNLSLTAYAGQSVYIGFRYDGGDPAKTTTFEIDDVKILKQ